MQASLRRTDLLEGRGAAPRRCPEALPRGAAIDDPNKKGRDQHGKRWALADQLDEARGEPEEAPPGSLPGRERPPRPTPYRRLPLLGLHDLGTARRIGKDAGNPSTSTQQM